VDSKLLLIKVITLLFLESQSKQNNNSASDLCLLAIGFIKTPDSAVLTDFSRDSLVHLLEIVRWMIANQPEDGFDKSDILQRVRMATETEIYIYDALASALEGDKTVEEVQKITKSSRDYINTFINRATIISIVKEQYHQIQFKPETVDWNHFVKGFISRLDPYKNTSTAAKKSLVESIDLSNLESLQIGFKSAVETLSSDGIIKFGWQAFNRMFGESGGGRRGEMVVVGALQHNFKSGTSLEMLKAAALYNRPFMFDATKKPMLLRISFENSAMVDLIHLYRSLLEPEIQASIDQQSIDPYEAAAYVYERLGVNGYHVQIDHFDPSEFTVYDLIETIEKYENDGYEIHMLNIDYLAMMSTKGCKQGATGQDIRDLFRRTRNAIESRGILTITPHQLSTDAKKLTRQGVEDFVKEIANKGYWDSCTTIDQEVDMEIYQHIVEVNGEKYLTFQRGKHRKPSVTPYRDLYFVMKFHPDFGFIPDDVLGKDTSLRRVGGQMVADGGAPAWFDMAA
jgi:hypothetical protein